MAGSVNKVILIGHLGADPESRSFPNGGKLVNFRMATSEAWKDRQSGERRERTEWHSISVLSSGSAGSPSSSGGGLVGVAERYLRKGSKVYVEGQLHTRKWQDQQGADRYTTEVVLNGFAAKLVLLDGAGGAGSGGGAGRDRGGGDARDEGAGSSGGFDDLDDEVPF